MCYNIIHQLGNDHLQTKKILKYKDRTDEKCDVWLDDDDGGDVFGRLAVHAMEVSIAVDLLRKNLQNKLKQFKKQFNVSINTK
jgi:Ni,Fe-hydrogenase III large subunit